MVWTLLDKVRMVELYYLNGQSVVLAQRAFCKAKAELNQCLFHVCLVMSWVFLEV